MAQQQFFEQRNSGFRPRLGAAHARQAAEALFQSSDIGSKAKLSAAPVRARKVPGSLDYVARHLRSRLLDLGGKTRSFEFVDLSEKTGKTGSLQARAALLFLISGRNGRHFYLAIQLNDGRAWRLPRWWSRLEDMGHAQVMMCVENAADAWVRVGKTLTVRGYS